MKTNNETEQHLGEELETLRRQVAQLQAECSQARQAQQQAETALAESERHLDLLTHQVPALVWTTDTNLTFTASLGAVLSTLDLQPCDMVGLSIYDYFQTQDRTFLPIAAHLRALKGESVTYEIGWVGRVFHSHIEPFRDEAGQIIGVIGVGVDMTEQKEAEVELHSYRDQLETMVEERTIELTLANEQLQQQIIERQGIERALRQSEKLYRTVLEQAAECIYLADGELLRIIEANSAMQRLLGYSADEITALTVYDFVAHDKDSIDRNRQRVQKEKFINVGDRRYRRKDGDLVDVEVAVSYIDFGDSDVFCVISHDITERKRAEQALQESEAKFRTLAELTTAAICIYQGNRMPYVNPAAQAITGYERAELLEQDFWEVIHPDFRDLARERGLARQRGEAVPPNYELQILTKAGEVRWVDATMGVIEYEGETAVLGTIFDITERKQAEQKILELNQKLFALQYAGATVASSLDLGYVLQSVTQEMMNLLNAEGCAILEWIRAANLVSVMAAHSPDDSWGQNLTNREYNILDYPLSKQVLQKRNACQVMISQTGLDEVTLAYMHTFQIKTLLLLPMEFQDRVVGLVEVMDRRVERVSNLDEVSLAQFLANQAAAAIENARLYHQARQEIAERRQIEEELRLVAARNQGILDALPDSMFYLSHDGRILDYKVADDDILLTPDNLNEPVIGQVLDETRLLPSQFIELIEQHSQQTLASGRMQVFEYQRSTLAGLQDFEVRVVVNSIDEVLAIIRNITDRKQAERQAIQTERLTALGRLAATLAHEINNPLQAIQSNLDLVLDFPLGPDESEEHLEIIRYEINRVRDIAQNVLNFANPKPAPRQEVSVTQLVKRALLLANKQLEQHGIQVTTNFQTVPAVMAAPDQLAQVFLNLVINASEALSNEGRLDVVIYLDGKNVAISFTNTGPVISPEIMTTIFEPFFTTKPEGSGLGLWISHSIVRQHAGTLTVENLSDQEGVIFTVKLPVVS